MAKDKNNNKQGTVTTTKNGVTQTKSVPLVVVDGKIVPDTTNPRNGVIQ